MSPELARKILEQVRQLSRDEQLALIDQIKREIGRRGSDHKRVRLMDLRGLGKEIWSEVDSDAYLRAERDSWRA